MGLVALDDACASDAVNIAAPVKPREVFHYVRYAWSLASGCAVHNAIALLGEPPFDVCAGTD